MKNVKKEVEKGRQEVIYDKLHEWIQFFKKGTYNPTIPGWDGNNFQLISQNNLGYLWNNGTYQFHVQPASWRSLGL